MILRALGFNLQLDDPLADRAASGLYRLCCIFDEVDQDLLDQYTVNGEQGQPLSDIRHQPHLVASQFNVCQFRGADNHGVDIGRAAVGLTALDEGALDFVQKPFNEDDLTALIERMLDRAQESFEQFHLAATRDALMAKLTSREAQVLERIVAGRLNKQIADDLNISIKTVEAHRANIMEKLNANTVADLLKIALTPAGNAKTA